MLGLKTFFNRLQKHLDPTFQKLEEEKAILKDGGPQNGLCAECSEKDRTTKLDPATIDEKIPEYINCLNCDQKCHTDFNFKQVDLDSDHRYLEKFLPYSYLGPLTDSGCTIFLKTKGYIHLNYGDFIFFRGDVQHSGVAYDLRISQYMRLHGYIPTTEYPREEEDRVFFRTRLADDGSNKRKKGDTADEDESDSKKKKIL